jgi:hypothetical protein
LERVEGRWLTIFERIEVERYVDGYKEAVDLKDFCLRMFACVCACVREREKERRREGETDKRKREERERNAMMQKERSKID